MEFHLLCVRLDVRWNGVGQALVQAALARAETTGAKSVVLWTQPTMEAAQRLYQRFGFRRDPSADFIREQRQFLVYRRALVGDR